ncbi:conserved hypothetical protein [Trichinella spiralis]|uniref:hypothetical protein n=1 Tax=Trichinella spiralis TaxID=6334 RepID=UPI0001EFC117|nr:conserved hypothetical protein [Trichinella spiralis]
MPCPKSPTVLMISILRLADVIDWSLNVGNVSHGRTCETLAAIQPARLQHAAARRRNAPPYSRSEGNLFSADAPQNHSQSVFDANPGVPWLLRIQTSPYPPVSARLCKFLLEYGRCTGSTTANRQARICWLALARQRRSRRRGALSKTSAPAQLHSARSSLRVRHRLPTATFAHISANTTVRNDRTLTIGPAFPGPGSKWFGWFASDDSFLHCQPPMLTVFGAKSAQLQRRF